MPSSEKPAYRAVISLPTPPTPPVEDAIDIGKALETSGLVMIETSGEDSRAYEKSVMDVLKLRGRIEIVAKGSLPNDGKVIEDRRSYD